MCRRVLLIGLLGGCGYLGAADGSIDSVVGIAAGDVAINAQGGAALDITLTAGGQPISAIQFDIRYPNQTLSVSVSTGAASTSSQKNVFTSDPASGLKRILIIGSNQTAIAGGAVATLALQTTGGVPPGVYPIQFSNAVGSDSNGMVVFLRPRDGSATVAGPDLSAVVNGASYSSGAVAPGEIVILGGRSLGPAGLNTLQIAPGGLVTTSLAGVRVLFDGIAAPILSTTPNQLSAVVPYEVDGESMISVQVEYQGIRSTSIVLPVAGSAPGIFTLDSSGSGQGAIVNEDGGTNGPTNPALRGSVVSIYATGEGQTKPRATDGSIVSPTNLRNPVLPVTAMIGDQTAEVIYAGSAGNQVAGLFQVSVRVPNSVTPGNVVVTLSVGGANTQSGVTMAVQ